MFSVPQYTWPLSRSTQKTLSLIEAEKSVTETLTGEKVNEQIKGMINSRRLVLYTHYNKSYPTFVPNVKILGAIVTEKFLTQISLCTTLE